MIRSIKGSVSVNINLGNQHLLKINLEDDFSHQPGQFITFFCANINLGVPLAIFQKNKRNITILVKKVGRRTEAICMLKKDEACYINAPLGQPTELVKDKNVLVVGGGVGIATIFEIASKLVKNNNVFIALCFRKNEDIALVSEYKKHFKSVFICCEEKSQYFRGNVIQMISTKKIKFDYYYVCGSLGLMRALENNYSQEGVLIMESPMACGYGVCNGCNIFLKGGAHKKVCQNTNFKSKTIDYSKLF